MPSLRTAVCFLLSLEFTNHSIFVIPVGGYSVLHYAALQYKNLYPVIHTDMVLVLSPYFSCVRTVENTRLWYTSSLPEIGIWGCEKAFPFVFRLIQRLQLPRTVDINEQPRAAVFRYYHILCFPDEEGFAFSRVFTMLDRMPKPG